MSSEITTHHLAISAMSFNMTRRYASKIISIANSAYYSRGIEIFDLQRAMLTIGFEEVQGIVTCLMFVENILKKLKLKEQDLFALWKHSIQVACSAKMLSERLLIEDPRKGVYNISAP